MKKLAIFVGTIGLAVVLVSTGFALEAVASQGPGGGGMAGYGPGNDRMGAGMPGYGYGYDAMGSGMMDYGPDAGVPGYDPGGGMMDYGPGHGMMGYGPGTYGSGYSSQYGMMGYGTGTYGAVCSQGYGMMGPDWGPWNAPYTTLGQGNVTSLDEATAAFQAYLDGLGYPDLEVTEVMEFQYNYYAILAEKDTGIGAMELLLDKGTGVVGPEPGPNMMWNANYSPMGRYSGMMGSYASEETTVTAQDAEVIAQRWLDANMPGTTAGDADPFYGYYTLHFLKDGQVVGMLSVQGSTGEVWYHSWHGDFVTMEGHS
jgi:hypothetical protein